jgi:hypothetical protein
MSDDANSHEATGDAGLVQLEFVDPPALNGAEVEWTYRTIGGRTAPSGTVVAEIVVTSHDHRILGGGTTTLHGDLGPHDIGGARFSPQQYTRDDGDYYLSITIGDDVRYVPYGIYDGQVHAPAR